MVYVVNDLKRNTESNINNSMQTTLFRSNTQTLKYSSNTKKKWSENQFGFTNSFQSRESWYY